MTYNKKKHSYKRYLLLIFLPLQVLFNYIPLHAQSIKDNVVKITARYPDNSEFTSFGFIFSEKDDSLYIVTTFNVFASDFGEIADSVYVEYHQKKYTSWAKPVRIFKERTCLLLRTEKPKDFLWNDNFCSASFIQEGDIAWIIGRYGNWNNASEEFIGQVVTSSGSEIVIDLPTKETGIIGAPIILNGCIAGIVINDQGNQVTAIDIGFIQLHVCDYLNIQIKRDLEQPYHLPYFIVGFNAGFPLFIQIMKYPASNNYGIFLETGFVPFLSFRFERIYSNIVSHSYKIWDTTYQFRNNYKSYSVSLLLTGQPTNFEAANFYLFLKYGSVHHNPELKLNNNNWVSLKNINEFNSNYSEKFNTYSIGFGANGFLTNRLLLGFEVSVQYHRNKYLYLNPLEPFAENKRNDWLIHFKLQTGIVLGNKKPEIKLLSPDKLSPFKF